MRIISGRLGGRVLDPPLKKWPTRPTTDISREALYNILAHRITFEDTVMLDLFGGTGAHVFEFVSRGCKDATYVDLHYQCCSWVKKQVKLLQIENYVKVYRSDVAKFIRRSNRQYDFIFADPPYALSWLQDIPDMVFDYNVLHEEGMLVVEHGSNLSFDQYAKLVETRKYGQSRFSFFEN